MRFTSKVLLACAGLMSAFTVPSPLTGPVPVSAAELIIWHDKGDDGIRMFKEIGDLYTKKHPSVTVKSLSFPTDQWFTKSIAAINTNTSPDLLFNDNFRHARIQQSTGKLYVFSDDLKKLDDTTRKQISAGDLDASLYDGKLIMLPTQRVQIALGARKSWLDKVGEKFPNTWEDFLRVAKKFQTDDPDGNGKNDTFGLALQAGDASVTHQMLEFLGFGAGLEHLIVDEKGNVVLDNPDNAKVLIEYLKIFTDYKIVSPETVNHIFTDMYQLIEGGRVGFFRVGDWNVKKWDTQAIKGDFEIGPLPVMLQGKTPSVVVHGMRSASVPNNGKQVAVAADFAAFMLTKEAQEISLKNMGSAIRNDVNTDGLSPHQLFFAAQKFRQAPNDFPESVHPWYPQFKEAWYKLMVEAIANPPKDWNGWVTQTANKLREDLKSMKKS